MENNIFVCQDSAYLNAVEQRKRFQLTNIPPTRYDNLATNPYPTYTKFDLDMRRKVEILKYNSNRMSTQTNSLTKAQKYTQLINGSYQRRTYSKYDLSVNVVNGILQTCVSSSDIKTSTVACDVPGPPILLYEDNNIPIYNLINTTNKQYGILNTQENMNIWNYDKNENIVVSSTEFTTINSIYILSSENPTNIFSITIPFYFNIYGSGITNVTYTPNDPLTITIKNAVINIKYSYNNVLLKNTPIYDYYKYTSNIRTTEIPIDISINIQNQDKFQANIYIGEITISNIFLYTQKGYVYDIQLKMDYNLIEPDINYKSKINSTIVTIYANPTSIPSSIPSGCSFLPPNPNNINIPKFSITSSL